MLEGKYWKRKLAAVTAQYKRVRVFNKHLTSSSSNTSHDHESVTDKIYKANVVEGSKDDVDLESMINDADYFVDALFNSLESQV